jgi:hypothetical protein
MAKFRVPTLSSTDNVVIRLADPGEIDKTNRLVFGNYVSAKYWENDAKNLQNIFLHTPMRKVVVALEDGEMVGTASVILDSAIGLPSDGGQRPLMQQLRNKGSVAEISGLAIDRSKAKHQKLVLFLLSYVFQYSYYYLGLDRVAASCVGSHANFYVSAGLFIKISSPTAYSDRSVAPLFTLLDLDFMQAHANLAGHVPGSFLSFMLREPHPCHRFPSESELKRSREINGLGSLLLDVA